MAQQLGLSDAAELLQQTLEEKGETDGLLTTIAMRITPAAQEGARACSSIPSSGREAGCTGNGLPASCFRAAACPGNGRTGCLRFVPRTTFKEKSMMRAICSGAAFALLTTAASAQNPPAQQPTTIAVAIQRAYATIKTNLTQAAERMPEADYGFKPSTMPEMRVYGALFAHIAQSQFGTCSVVSGVPNPAQGRQLETELTTKAQIVAALAESFTLCDTAYASLTDANANELVTGGRGGPTARAALLANNVTHDNEMAGTAYVYLRARNIVPPSTENAAAARGGGAGGGGRGRGAGAPPPGQ
jgi:hypothetical protein